MLTSPSCSLSEQSEGVVRSVSVRDRFERREVFEEEIEVDDISAERKIFNGLGIRDGRVDDVELDKLRTDVIDISAELSPVSDSTRCATRLSPDISSVTGTFIIIAG